MNTPDEIKRQLDELDIEFESPQNQKSGKLDFARWSARRAELIALQRHAERVGRTEPAPPAVYHFWDSAAYTVPQYRVAKADCASYRATLGCSSSLFYEHQQLDGK